MGFVFGCKVKRNINFPFKQRKNASVNVCLFQSFTSQKHPHAISRRATPQRKSILFRHINTGQTLQRPVHLYPYIRKFVFIHYVAFIKGRVRDKCLKEFSGYPVTVECSGKCIWGVLRVENTGLEILYEKPESNKYM